MVHGGGNTAPHFPAPASKALGGTPPKVSNCSLFQLSTNPRHNSPTLHPSRGHHMLPNCLPVSEPHSVTALTTTRAGKIPEGAYIKRFRQNRSWALGEVQLRKKKGNLSMQLHKSWSKSHRSAWQILHMWNTWRDNECSHNSDLILKRVGNFEGKYMWELGQIRV